jgi:acetyl-CoA C-acetyltransferase
VTSGPRDVVVIAVARSPFGRFAGALQHVAAPTLAARTVDEVMRRSRIEPARVDALYAGVGMIGAAVLTPTRQALLQSCLPQRTPSLAVDRACCSGMTAIGLAWKDIALGQADMIVCGGFESLSQTPFLWPRQRGAHPGPVDVKDPLQLRADFIDKAIASYTGEEAVRAGVGRGQQDAWAVQSHRRYFAAEDASYFEFERFAWTGQSDKDTTLVADENPRRDTSVERLAQLNTVYGSPTITPGNAPGLNDGAAFLLLASREAASAAGAQPLARIRDYIQIADGPTAGAYTPGLAIARLMERDRRSASDLNLIEINEAFAATPLVSTLLLADRDERRADQLREKTNLHGGAVALGHPLGASGARIAMTLINGLRRKDGGLGAAAICGGFGQGDGLLLEVA